MQLVLDNLKMVESISILKKTNECFSFSFVGILILS